MGIHHLMYQLNDSFVSVCIFSHQVNVTCAIISMVYHHMTDASKKTIAVCRVVRGGGER